MTISATEALRAALAPQSIALIGASDNPNKIGGRPLAYLARSHYAGSVYAITPTRDKVQGLTAFKNLWALPEAPEVAIIAVAGDRALTAVDECAQAGVKAAIVMSSGFAETDATGKAREQQMVSLARRSGMRLIGPNSQGLANFGTGAVMSFSTMFMETAPLDGPVAIVSQSGSMSAVPYGLLRARGVGVRHMHATGNDGDVTVCELASVVVEDPGVKLLLLYLEGIPDPWNLAETARIARQKGVAVVALKSGRSQAGQKAISSHTGALAGEDRIVDAFFREHGIWRAETVVDLVDTAELYLKGWKPKGRKLVAISHSGAVCVLAADAAAAAGLALDPLASSTQADLRKVLPTFATTTNPIDITAALLGNGRLFADVLPIVARDAAADAFLIGIPVAGEGYDLDSMARDSSEFARVTGKPVVMAAPQKSVAQAFKAHGLSVYPTEHQAIRALSHYLSHVELLQSLALRDASRVPTSQGPNLATSTSRTLTVATESLDEAKSLQLLQRHGVPVVTHHVCTTENQAIAAFESLGCTPVVVKGCSPEVTHKSELGLVHLGASNAEAVLASYRAIQKAAGAANIQLTGVIVAQMVRGYKELMIGARRDPVFGPVLVVGDGGKYVEIMPDSQVLLPPFTPEGILWALKKLRIAPLLDGVRGEPGLDVAAFCDAAMRVGQMMLDPSSRVDSLDINPVLVAPRGGGCIAVDAVVIHAKAASWEADKVGATDVAEMTLCK